MSSMTDHIRGQTQLGIDDLAKRLAAKGLRVLEQRRFSGHQHAIYFAIGNDGAQTDVSISNSFLDDLPNTKEHQAAVDSYAHAVAGRIKLGSPEVFYCRSGAAVRISILWPIQSGIANNMVLTFVLMEVTNQLDQQVAKCSMEIGFSFSQTTFDIVLQTITSTRIALDEGQIKFYDPGVRQDVFQRIKRQDRPNPCSQSEVERFLEDKAYFLGFFAVEQPSEVWAADPWDAHYLGVSTKELSLAMRVLKARGLLENGSSYEYWKPADKLLAREASGDKSGLDLFQPQRDLSRLSLPKKEDLLKDMQTVLERHPVTALLVMDLDHFKSVNDKKGHSEGDACLDQVVRTLAAIVGRKGRIYRWGSGDEFAICLPDFSTEEAEVTAERIRRGVEEARPGGDIAVTASVGVCASDRAVSKSATEILDSADKAMYKAKERRNRVIAWPLEATSVAPVDSTQKEGKQAIKGKLTQFLKEGKDIQRDFEYNNPNAPHRKQEWETAVERYLAKNLDESYAVRFQTPIQHSASYPEGINAKMLRSWSDTGAKMAMLNTFISELRE